MSEDNKTFNEPILIFQVDTNNESDEEYIEELEEVPYHRTHPHKARITKPFMTKYEKAKILGTRAMQISRNAPIFVELGPNDTDALSIAEKELYEKKLPFIVRRYLPDDQYEDWLASELEINY